MNNEHVEQLLYPTEKSLGKYEILIEYFATFTKRLKKKEHITNIAGGIQRRTSGRIDVFPVLLSLSDIGNFTSSGKIPGIS